jgi:membrane-associated protease RseP (regulator of RpoE activity)
VELLGQRIGIGLLLLLMCFAFYNDLARIFQ